LVEVAVGAGGAGGALFGGAVLAPKEAVFADSERIIEHFRGTLFGALSIEQNLRRVTLRALVGVRARAPQTRRVTRQAKVYLFIKPIDARSAAGTHTHTTAQGTSPADVLAFGCQRKVSFGTRV
jgi:hypothetical protein